MFGKKFNLLFLIKLVQTTVIENCYHFTECEIQISPNNVVISSN